MARNKRSRVVAAVRAASGLAAAVRSSNDASARVRDALGPQGDPPPAATTARSGAAAPLGEPRASRTGQVANKREFGRDAASPIEIPPRGWWQILERTARKFSENELMSRAAGVTFYALLSLFPAITAIVSIYGLFADPKTIQEHLGQIGTFVPSGGMEIIREQVQRLTTSPPGGLSAGAAIGVLAALWSANQGTKALFSSLTDVYGERDERGFIKVTLLTLAFTIGGIGVLLLGLGLIVVLPIAFDFLHVRGAFDATITSIKWPVLVVALMMALATLYRFGPHRRLARWRWVTWGGAVAAIGWIGLSLGFSWYVAHFGSYNRTYGSLGAIIGFMTWIWLSSMVVLLGAQLNAEMEAQTDRDTSVAGGPGRPGGASR